MKIDLEKIRLLKNKVFETDAITINRIFIEIIKNNNIKLLNKVFGDKVRDITTLSTQEVLQNIGFTLVQNQKDGTNEDYVLIIKYLHKYFPDLPETFGNNRISLLAEAAIWGKDKIVQLLLEYQYNLDAKDDDGSTALHKAIMHKQNNVVKMLCDKGASYTLENRAGMSPLFISLAYENKEAQKTLLQFGANVGTKSRPEFSDKPINLSDFAQLLTRMKFSPPQPLLSEKEPEYYIPFRNSVISYFQTLFADDQKAMINYAKNICDLAIKSLKLNPPKENIEIILVNITNLLGLKVLAYDDAHRIFSKIQKLHGSLPSLMYNNMAVYYLNNEEYTKAEVCAQQAIKQELAGPGLELGAIYYNLYRALYKQGRVLQAELAVIEAQKYIPEDLDISLALIQINLDKGSYSEAFRLINSAAPQVIELGDSGAVAETYRALSMNIIADGGDGDLALMSLERAIELDPQNVSLKSQKILFKIYQASKKTTTKLDFSAEYIVLNDLIEDKKVEPLGDQEREEPSTTIDSLVAVELLNYLPEDKKEEFLDNQIFDPVAIHQYFTSKKKLTIQSFTKEKPEESWHIDSTHTFKSTDPDLHQVSYFGQFIYATIDRKLFNKLDLI
jgi:tetratricopeptide (TPR) repeat protein